RRQVREVLRRPGLPHPDVRDGLLFERVRVRMLRRAELRFGLRLLYPRARAHRDVRALVRRRRPAMRDGRRVPRHRRMWGSRRLTWCVSLTMRSRIVIAIVLCACGGKIAGNTAPSADLDPGDPKATPNPLAPNHARPIICGASTCDADQFEKCCAVGAAPP